MFHRTKKNTRRIAVSAGAALATVALAATTALAAPLTYTVTAGSAPPGTTVNWTATTVDVPNAPDIVFTDVTDGITMTCESGSATGHVTTDSGLPGAGIGTITGASFMNCQGLGISLTVIPHTPWSLDATGATSGGVTSGQISSIDATVVDSGTGGILCSFDVTGTVGGSYDNSTTELNLPGTNATLTITNVNGCFGLITEDAEATYEATYDVTADNPSYNPIHINSN